MNDRETFQFWKIFSSNSTNILFIISSSNRISSNKFPTTVVLFACVQTIALRGNCPVVTEKKKENLLASNHKQIAYLFDVSDVLSSNKYAMYKQKRRKATSIEHIRKINRELVNDSSPMVFPCFLFK